MKVPIYSTKLASKHEVDHGMLAVFSLNVHITTMMLQQWQQRWQQPVHGNPNSLSVAACFDCSFFS